MRVYDCDTAPSPKLVRKFIAAKGVEIETVSVDLRAGQHLSDAFTKLNPLCAVPVLELADGEALLSTQACWRYLEETCPSPPLLGTTAHEKAIIADRLWYLDVQGWQAATEGLRNSIKGFENRALTGPHDYAQIPELGDRGKIRTRRALDYIENLLSENDFIAGDKFSAADIFADVLIEFARWIKIAPPAEAKGIKAWQRRIGDSYEDEEEGESESTSRSKEESDTSAMTQIVNLTK